MTIEDAIKAVAAHCPNGYAVAYAEAWDTNVTLGHAQGYTAGEAQKIQATYILGNLSGWRGDEAALVRAVIKKFAKVTLTKKDKEAFDNQKGGAP